MIEFLTHMRPLTAQFTSDDATYWKSFLAILKSCEHPGFTGFQSAYWISQENSRGQSSLGYLLGSSSPYKPSPSESPESLREIDHEFEAAYEALNHLSHHF